MGKSALILSAVVKDGDVLITEDHESAQRQRAAKRWGEGCALKIRIEPEDEAKKHHQLKFYFGYVVKPCVEHTGYTMTEMDAIFRGLFMPADVETLSDMSYDQMALFNIACEEYAARVIGVQIERPLSA